MYSHAPRIAALAAAGAILATACFGGTPTASTPPADGATAVSTGSDVKATLLANLGSDTKKVEFTFASVSFAGQVKAEPAAAIPALPTGFARTAAFDISSTASFDKATVCFDNDKVTATSKLYHHKGVTWEDRTTSVSPPTICGEFTSFSPVAIVDVQAATPTPAATTAAPTATAAPTEAATATPTATVAATATAASTVAATKTPTPTTAATPAPTVAATKTPAPTATPSPTPSPTPTPTPAPAGTLAPSPPATGLHVSGKITDAATGEPIDKACITIGPPSACATTTDRNGNYFFDLLEGTPAGLNWTVSALRNTVDPKYAIKSVTVSVSGPTVVNIQLSKQ